MSLKELAPSYYTRLREVLREVGKADYLLNAGCGDGVYDHYLKNNHVHALNQVITFLTFCSKNILGRPTISKDGSW